MSLDKKKKESIERLKNHLEQAKLNLKLASESGDNCEIKNWSKQIRLIQNVLQRSQEILAKKS